jgi:hypothetical protein
MGGRMHAGVGACWVVNTPTTPGPPTPHTRPPPPINHLDVLPRAVVVLVKGLEPPRVVVAVGDEVDVDGGGGGARGGGGGSLSSSCVCSLGSRGAGCGREEAWCKGSLSFGGSWSVHASFVV